MIPKKIKVSFNLPSVIFSKTMDRVEDLYEDMERLNMLYGEMCWDHNVKLEFKADYENNRIIIKPKD
jgi:hypothetical protein